MKSLAAWPTCGENDVPQADTIEEDDDRASWTAAVPLDFEFEWGDDVDLQATLHILEPPDLPDRLDPGQAAQLSELIEYLHIRLRRLLGSVKMDRPTNSVVARPTTMAESGRPASPSGRYLRTIGEPGGHQQIGSSAGLTRSLARRIRRVTQLR